MQVTETVSEGLKRELTITIGAATLDERVMGKLDEMKKITEGIKLTDKEKEQIEQDVFDLVGSDVDKSAGGGGSTTAAGSCASRC
ncbi:MAG: hypothetical protein COB48_06010 [Pseudoalteromonas sp.]|nr:MAG: hypothetical protein COB48_06010 [Pseudoalteromonas sp.]